MRQFCVEKNVECDLEKDIDVLELYKSENELKEDVGFFFPFGDVLMPLFGAEILHTRSQLKKYLPALRDDSPYKCGLVRKKSADTFWPAKFAESLIIEAERCGAKCFPSTNVINIEIEESNDRKTKSVIVTTNKGSIRCKHCVVATNAYTSALLPDFAAKITPVRNHVVNTSPVQSLSGTNRGIGISCENGFVYFMQRPDKRIILGGFRQLEKNFGVNVADDCNLDPAVVDHAANFLDTHFHGFELIDSADGTGNRPGTMQIEHKWAGIIGWSADNMPWCGPHPDHPNELFICAGFSGHGMTQAFLCGSAVADMIRTGQPPKLFVPAFLPSVNRKNIADLHRGNCD